MASVNLVEMISRKRMITEIVAAIGSRFNGCSREVFRLPPGLQVLG